MTQGCPGGSEGKVSACRAGDLGLIPGSRRSTGEGNGHLLQYSCLENSRRILVGCSPSDRKELHMTEQLHFFTVDGGGAIFWIQRLFTPEPVLRHYTLLQILKTFKDAKCWILNFPEVQKRWRGGGGLWFDILDWEPLKSQVMSLW